MVQVPTARGDSIDSSELGFCAPTEMIFTVTNTDVDVNWPDVSFGAVPLEERVADAVKKMTIAKEHGVDTIVDRAIVETTTHLHIRLVPSCRVPTLSLGDRRTSPE